MRAGAAGPAPPTAAPAASWLIRGIGLLPLTAVVCVGLLVLKAVPPSAVPPPRPSLVTLPEPFEPAPDVAAVTPPIDTIIPEAGPPAAGMGGVAAAPPGYELSVLQRLADEIGARNAALDARGREVDARAARLKLTEEAVAAQLTRLEALRDDLGGLLGRVDKDQEERLARLVKVYEGMKAKSAAPIIQALEPALALALRVLRRMREPKVAAIVAEMATDPARALTAALARPAELPRLP